MEQRYWEQFMKTGGVCDYLGYKMEEYGHRGEVNRESDEREIQKDAEPAVIPLYRQKDDSL